jgi:hypothetical protein
MNIIMLGGPLIYCTLLFSFDFYLTGSSIYVYMSELVGRWIETRVLCSKCEGNETEISKTNTN